jgi:hypothetical protein
MSSEPRSAAGGDDPAETPDQEPVPGRMRGQDVQTWVDQAIQQAQRRGDFDNLRGAGKPLRSLEQPHDPDWWLKGLLEREQIDPVAALPGPMALRRERETFPEALADIRDERQVREVLEDFNARVVEDRLRPTFGPTLPVVVPRVDVEEMVLRWRELRADTAAPGGDTLGKPEDDPGAAAVRRRRWWWGRRRSR